MAVCNLMNLVKWYIHREIEIRWEFVRCRTSMGADACHKCTELSKRTSIVILEFVE